MPLQHVILRRGVKRDGLRGVSTPAERYTVERSRPFPGITGKASDKNNTCCPSFGCIGQVSGQFNLIIVSLSFIEELAYTIVQDIFLPFFPPPIAPRWGACGGYFMPPRHHEWRYDSSGFRRSRYIIGAASYRSTAMCYRIRGAHIYHDMQGAGFTGVSSQHHNRSMHIIFNLHFCFF